MKLKSLFYSFLILLSHSLYAQALAKFPKSTSNAYGFVLATPTSGVVNNMPCIIHLHGVGGQGNGSDADLQRLVEGELPQELQKAADKYKIVVIAPQVADWNYTNAINHVKKYALDLLKVDANRIHLWGLSAGGSGVIGYISSSVTNASQFASSVIVCGAGTVSTSGAKNIGDAKLPTIFFHAQDDGTVNVSNTNTSVTNINNYINAFPAKKVIYSAGQHWIWGKVYHPDVWPWIGNESKGLYEWALSVTRGNPKPVPEVAPSTEMIVRAGDDFTTTENKIRLDGSESTNWKSASWRVVSVPNGVNIWGISACGYITCDNVSLPAQGEYQFELKCVDSKGAFKTDTVKVTYSNSGSSTTNPSPTTPIKTIIARVYVGGYEFVLYSDGSSESKK